ncbi:MAG: ABC transporter permease [Clostridium sp.]|nr:ABC transporter permease [Clostridium sp.]MCM1548069.1 ABC transporter permease [Ruminococcus sp.]
MGKFIGLVKNEYIKQIHKVGVWVMLIILLLSAIGSSGFALLAKNIDESFGDSLENDIIESYQSELTHLESAKPDGWEHDAEMYQYFINNKLTDGWKLEAAETMFNIKSLSGILEASGSNQLSAAIDNIDKSIKNNEWKAFYQAAIDISEDHPNIIDESDIALYKECLEEDIVPEDDNWKYNTVSELMICKYALKTAEENKASGIPVDVEEMNLNNEKCKKYQYRLDNNIEFDISENQSWIDGNYNFWSVFCSSSSIVSFIGVFVIIIAGGIVSGEFSSGTIKFLMINPVKRWKILVSKYFTAMTLGYIAMLGVYIISMLTTMLLFGAENLGASYITVSGDKVSEISGFLYIAKLYLIKSVGFIVMGSLAFAISSLFRSSALAIGISVMAYTGGSTVTMVLSQLQFDWGRYLIFSNLDLTSIAEGNSMFTDQTVGAALAVIAVHMIIFLLTAWDGFTRREV